MNSERIIIIRSNPVCPDARVEKEALALSKQGYAVAILCWDRNSNHKLIVDNLLINNRKIPIYRLGFKASYGEGFKNIVPYLKFQFSMRKWLRNNSDTICAIHACDFDTAFFSYKLALKKQKIFVFDIFDFLYGDPRNLLQRIVKKAQLSIIDKADATIICTEKREQQITGSCPKRLVVIHNTPSKDQLPREICFSPRVSKKPKVCYIGILQDGRLLKEVGQFFSNNNQYEFHIGGFGYLDSYFYNLSQRNDNIFFYGRIPYERTLELEANSDIMLAIYDPTIENHRFAAPNKFYESLLLGKPIIMVRNTGMSEIVEDTHIGVLIEYSYEEFARGLEYLCSLKGEWSDMSKKAKQLYREFYNWETMESRLQVLYKELIK